ATKGAPINDFATSDGIQHTVWVLGREDTARLHERFQAVPVLYVADGHHRSAAAARVHKTLRGDGGQHHAFLAVVFPHDQMKSLPYNRVVRDLEGRSPEALLAALRERLEIEPAPDGAAATPRAPKQLGIYLGGKWYRARVKKGSYDESDPVKSL